jgi:hypothetical protein
MNRMLLVAVLAVIGWVRLPLQFKGDLNCPADICMPFQYGEDVFVTVYVTGTEVDAIGMGTDLNVSQADWEEGYKFVIDLLFTFGNPTSKEVSCLSNSANVFKEKTCGRFGYSSTDTGYSFVQVWMWDTNTIHAPMTTDL